MGMMRRRLWQRLAVAILVLGSGSLTLSQGACEGGGIQSQGATTEPTQASSQVRDELQAHRLQEIQRLREYAMAGVFPRNFTSDTPLHMFKDPDGRRCAVANLIHLDGHDDLVDSTARTDNDLVVATVTSGPIYDWVLTSGLTMEEVAAIQAPAPRIYPRDTAVAVPSAPLRPNEAVVQDQLRQHFAQVEQQLIADTDKSLDLAVARLAASRVSAAS
jgi:hypothetical protein